MGQQSTGAARLLMLGAVVLALAVGGFLVQPDTSARADSATALDLSTPAVATATAVRGEQIRIRPLPSRAGCERVAVIGDSLMDNARWHLRSALDGAGLTSVIDAQPSRRIPESVRAPYSGVIAARQVRATWGEADCWVIALGSNDLIFGGGEATVASALIDSMLATVSPGSTVWWVNLDYHLDPEISFDFVGATTRFNGALLRSEQAGKLTVIDWYSLAEAHLDWFFDPVHVNTGVASQARAKLVVDAITD